MNNGTLPLTYLEVAKSIRFDIWPRLSMFLNLGDIMGGSN